MYSASLLSFISIVSSHQSIHHYLLGCLLHHDPAIATMLRSLRSSNSKLAVRSITHKRAYATEAGSVKALLFLEHRDGQINPGSLNALSAATALGGDVVGLVTGEGEDAQKVAEAAKKSVFMFELGGPVGPAPDDEAITFARETRKNARRS